MSNMDIQKRDCFELLSAYLDGEVTASERKQVEEWLSTDDSFKCLYKRLLNLRKGLQNIPVPPTNQSSETTIEQVLKRVKRPYDLAWIFGGAALAACILGTVSTLFPGNSSRILQMAETTELTPAVTQPAISDSSLMVALNKPVMEIPKTAIAPK
ncbi:anti-sigma factor family protein [Dolichospermum circinale]|uniref:anti-sigma factor family protein n=1 Tax=Dolichospermum circinale TaxID=109265 RepID=UPI0004291964|nr:zf-HC2 domain-containing protein [Dolichospermum circinale]MDB9453390.1 zf-HC2 domain-containing protein [Dolichospermum circinale CS-541/06]MDB9463036.1 zf-HC2 domain-containing protein [Dolichospermum circinale CS-541/04]MDB9475409.1 zf-HC2 domain-containing protein [Dolichospermum circinale CS-537/11]MDB9477285.1 zf-HC2 domain-containing protein [Dolichospermum circinale CS-537/03]MDB9546278.1 zf-HC2 domain-containing protein [Dolichospermum circinale CS-1031]